MLQYVISHFYNTGQICKIELFYERLIENIILRKEKGKPFVILINDVNSNNRGRDLFESLCKNLLMLVCMVVTRSTTLIIEYKMTIKDMVKNIQVILYCMICRQIYQNMSLGNTVQVLK